MSVYSCPGMVKYVWAIHRLLLCLSGIQLHVVYDLSSVKRSDECLWHTIPTLIVEKPHTHYKHLDSDLFENYCKM